MTTKNEHHVDYQKFGFSWQPWIKFRYRPVRGFCSPILFCPVCRNWFRFGTINSAKDNINTWIKSRNSTVNSVRHRTMQKTPIKQMKNPTIPRLKLTSVQLEHFETVTKLTIRQVPVCAVLFVVATTIACNFFKCCTKVLPLQNRSALCLSIIKTEQSSFT